MVTFEYRFDVLPGKLKEYERYTKGPGKDIWLKFKGVKGVRVYKSMLGGSSPQRLIQVDLESLAALENILTDSGFRKLKYIVPQPRHARERFPAHAGKRQEEVATL